MIEGFLGTIGILADDLTGANDTGVQFSRLGSPVLVLVSLEHLPGRLERRWDAVVLDTGSRNLPPPEARARVGRALEYLERQAIPLVYKKIDSTLRGPWVEELEELFARGCPRAFVAPAFPLNGRTVEGGVLRVGGVPLERTESARDGLSPVASGHLPSLLAPAFGSAVGALALPDLARGAGSLGARLQALEREGRRVIVCDAREQGELALLAEALLSALPGPVLVGSAGLARELAACLPPRHAAPAPQAPEVPGAQDRPGPAAGALLEALVGPVLVVAGSRSAVTARQVAELTRAFPAAHAEIAPEWVDGPWEQSRARELGARIEGTLAAGLAMLAQPPGSPGPLWLITIGEGEQGLPHERFQARSARLNRVIGAAIVEVLRRRPLAGLVLTGGDVAAAAIEALEADGIELGEEVLPGIPMGRLAGGTHAGLPLVTKAGGFGPSEALSRAVRALREGARATART